jgi:twitching motility protein PilU
MIITPLLQLAADRKASDLFFSVGAPINIKIDGVVMPVNSQKLDEETVKRIVYEMMTEQQINEFELNMEMNFSFRVASIGNFRVNVFRQRSSVAMVIRYVRGDVLNVEELNLPLVLKELVMEKRGLVLMVGATGSGKSTTLAAMIQHRNETQSGHILTIEDPLEYMFRHGKSIVNQREVGTDTANYESALISAMREAPDVLMVGEIRDRETLKHGNPRPGDVETCADLRPDRPLVPVHPARQQQLPCAQPYGELLSLRCTQQHLVRPFSLLACRHFAASDPQCTRQADASR